MLASIRFGEQPEGADEMLSWHTMGYPRREQRISVFHRIVVSLAPSFVG